MLINNQNAQNEDQKVLQQNKGKDYFVSKDKLKQAYNLKKNKENY